MPEVQVTQEQLREMAVRLESRVADEMPGDTPHDRAVLMGLGMLADAILDGLKVKK